MFEHHKKESPILSLAGMGGGPTSYILYSAAGGGDVFEISRSLRFNKDDSAYLNRTPSSEGNRRTWTISVWCKKTANGIYMPLINANNSTNPYLNLSFTDADKIRWLDGSNQGQVLTDAAFRDNSAWYHIVCATDTTLSTATDRVKIYVNGVRQDVTFPTTVTQNHQTQVNNTTEHRIGRWLGTSTLYLHGYLADYYLIDGQALDPTSFGEFDSNNVWQPKSYSGTYGTNGFSLKFDSYATSADLGTDSSSNNNTWTVNNISVSEGEEFSVYGEVTNSSRSTTNISSLSLLQSSSKYFTTGGTAHNLITADFGSVGSHTIYAGQYLSNASFSGTIAQSDDGSSWTSISKGQDPFTFSGRYIQWARSGSGYGDEFIETQTVAAGNDSLIDTPTNYSASGNNPGNYATLNPLVLINGGSSVFSDGNLSLRGGSTNGATASTINPTSGKYYLELEIKFLAGQSKSNMGVGVVNELNYSAGNPSGNSYPSTFCGFFARTEINSVVNGSETGAQTTEPNGIDYILGIAFDYDAETITLYLNGTQGNTVSFSSVANPLIYFNWGNTNNTMVVNFGQRPFAYTPPTNHLSICTQNLSNPEIADGSTAMDAKLYTGNGSTQTISGLGFNPDLVWLKNRASGSYGHRLVDSVRGSTKYLMSHSTGAEATDSNGVTAFNSDGFDLGSSGDFNVNNNAFVAWTWDGGTSTVSNTDGSVTSSVRANVSAGFSIVEFTNPSSGEWTFGHGLNAAPEFFVMRPKGATSNWQIYHKGLTAISSGRKFIWLNSTNAEMGASNTYWTSDPDSSVCYAGTGMQPGSQQVHIAYCFSPVDAYNSFGTYRGNGATDGPFVYTGHRGRFIMIKRYDANGDWLIYDTARDEVNTATKRLYPNLPNAEADASGQELDFLSNGFKIRGGSNANYNASGGTYIYASFAEHPFKTSRAR